MPTTSQQLDDFATTIENTLVWTPDMTGQLIDLITEPAMSIFGQTIPPNDRTKAMDNIYRCKPMGWIRAEQELMPKADGTRSGAVAGFSLWAPDDYSNPASNFGLKMEVGIQKPCTTLLLAMVAATARVWAYILRQAGR